MPAGGSSSGSSLDQLFAWLRSVGIWWDERIVIRDGCSGCSGPALGVFAVTDLPEDQLLCVIPRSAILSPRTTRLAAVLEQEKLGGGMALTIAVMYENSLGLASKWAGYLASLPRREYIPIFWTDEELQLLQGSSLEGKAVEDRTYTQEDYNTHVAPLLAKYPQFFQHAGRCQLEDFRVAASWVASRSFHVDAWHGDAMVPLADIFNHKASVVMLGDGWGVAELDDLSKTQHQSNGDCHDDSSQDPDESSSKASGSAKEGLPSPSSTSMTDEVEESGHEAEGEDATSSEVPSEQWQDGEEEEAQHGFAVGGMPILSSQPCSVVRGSSGASRWIRDGLNLRLEIGICSLGAADSRHLPSVADAAAAAAAAAASEAVEPTEPSLPSSAARGPPNKRRKLSQSQQHLQQETGQASQCKLQGSGNLQEQQQQQQQGGQDPVALFQQWPEKRLEIVAASDISAGAEVHNTYGELSNSLLVQKYGFCLPQNPFDEVTLCESWAEFITGGDLTALEGQPQLQKHVQWLQQHSNLMADDASEDVDSPGPPCITPGGRLSMVTAAVVRLLGASIEQLQQWQGLEDVLPNPDADKDAEGSDGAAAALSRHFDDVKLSQHSLAWWGRAGLEQLAAAAKTRLQRFPTSLADTTLALKQHQEQQQDCEASSVGRSEHAAAVQAALQLRMCEQKALCDVISAVDGLLKDTGRQDGRS